MHGLHRNVEGDPIVMGDDTNAAVEGALSGQPEQVHLEVGPLVNEARGRRLTILYLRDETRRARGGGHVKKGPPVDELGPRGLTILQVVTTLIFLLLLLLQNVVLLFHLSLIVG